jgi:hypothetical protein
MLNGIKLKKKEVGGLCRRNETFELHNTSAEKPGREITVKTPGPNHWVQQSRRLPSLSLHLKMETDLLSKTLSFTVIYIERCMTDKVQEPSNSAYRTAL